MSQPDLSDWNFQGEYEPITQMLTCEAPGVKFDKTKLPTVFISTWCKALPGNKVYATIFHQQNEGDTWIKGKVVELSDTDYMITFEVEHFSNWFVALYKRLFTQVSIRVAHLLFMPAECDPVRYPIKVRSVVTKCNKIKMQEIRILHKDHNLPEHCSGDFFFDLGNERLSFTFTVYPQMNAKVQETGHKITEKEKQKLILNPLEKEFWIYQIDEDFGETYFQTVRKLDGKECSMNRHRHYNECIPGTSRHFTSIIPGERSDGKNEKVFLDEETEVKRPVSPSGEGFAKGNAQTSTMRSSSPPHEVHQHIHYTDKRKFVDKRQVNISKVRDSNLNMQGLLQPSIGLRSTSQMQKPSLGLPSTSQSETEYQDQPIDMQEE